MNTYYQENGQVNSNNDIFELYFYEGAKKAPAWKRAADRILALVSALIAILCGAHVRTALRVGGVALSLVGLIGVIGAMESGSLNLAVGVLLGAILVGLEYLCLRHKV